MHAKFLKLKLPHTLCKTNYLKHSFYYRSIATWNKLPVDIKSTNQSLSSFKKRILDIFTRNTPSDVLPASGVYGDTCVSVYGEGGKGSLRIGGGGGGGRYLRFYSIWFLAQDINWDIVLSPAPVAIFIYLFFYPTYFYYFFMYILIDSMQRIQ